MKHKVIGIIGVLLLVMGAALIILQLMAREKSVIGSSAGCHRYRASLVAISVHGFRAAAETIGQFQTYGLASVPMNEASWTLLIVFNPRFPSKKISKTVA